MDQEELQEQIERYLEEKMTPEEKLAFDQKMEADEAVAQSVQLEKEINAALNDPTGLALEKDLQNVGKEFVEKYKESQGATVKPLLPGNRKWWLAAAGILMLLSFWFAQRSFLSPNTDQLFAAAYQPYIATTATRSFDPTQENTFQQALKAYQAGAYPEALASFEKLLQESTPSNDDQLTLQFYQGLSHLALENSHQAIPYFQGLIKENKNLYVQQSRWYLSLCYLQQGEVEKTKTLLQEIIDQSASGKYFHLAKELLEKL